MTLIRNRRRKRNLSDEVQEADEIRHLDSEFEERENNFGEMRITLTGPSRNRKNKHFKLMFWLAD